MTSGRNRAGRELPASAEDGRASELDVGLDPGFPRRVCRTTTLVAGIIALMLAGRFGWAVAGGLLAGAALSIVGMLTTQFIVRRMAWPAPGGQRKVLVALFGKLPAMAVAIALVVRAAGDDQGVLAALCGGVALLPAVIVLKVAGRALNRALGAPGRSESRRAG